MTGRQAKIALIASVAIALLSVVGALASIGRPTQPTIMVVSGSSDACIPADLRIVVVNFPPDTPVALSVSIEDGDWSDLGTKARTDALGETDVRVADTAQLVPTGCDPLAPASYRFRATSEDGETEATTEARPLTSYTADWVTEPGRVPQPADAVGAPVLFLAGILGLLGMLVSGAFVAYPRTPRPPPRR